jgi:hypothetical protein
MVCDKVKAEAAEADEEEAAGYRIKNKNPTQRCGEKRFSHSSLKVSHTRHSMRMICKAASEAAS